MNETVRVSTEKITGCAKDIQIKIGVIRKNYQTMEDLSRKFPGVWEGEAFDFHRGKLNEFFTQASEILNEIEKQPDRILQMTGIYSAGEETNKGLIGRLNKDIIK